MPEVRLTDEQVSEGFRRIFEKASALTDWTESVKGLAPVSGSALAGDDKASAPYQVSHGVRGSLRIAAEHLDALQHLIGEAGVLHPSVPFTLVRGSIEAAAAALWILSPSLRSERVLRRLRFLAKDARNSNSAFTKIGALATLTLDERLEKLFVIARRVAKDPGAKLVSPTSSEIVEAADTASKSLLNVFAAWQVCSGFAHGMPWVGLAVLNREVSETDEEGVLSLRLTSSLDRVLWAAQSAMDIIDKAHAEYIRMSQDYVMVK